MLHLAVPHLSADLQPSSTQLLWITDIYGFLIAGVLITMGDLGDRIGRRRLLFIGATAFGIASVLAAYFTSAELLIATRALLGVAGATLMPSTAISLWMMSFMVGGSIGPLVGGALLLLATALPVIYGIKEVAKGSPAGWPAVAIVAGMAVGVLFVKRQRSLPNPLIDVTLFRNPAFSVSLGAMTAAAFVMMGLNLFLMQYLQLVHGLSPWHAGLWVLPMTAAGMVGMIVTPMLTRWIRPASARSSWSSSCRGRQRWADGRHRRAGRRPAPPHPATPGAGGHRSRFAGDRALDTVTEKAEPTSHITMASVRTRP